MDESPQPGASPRIDQISTRWSLIQQPLQFVLRYAPAIQAYLSALIRDPHDAEEVSQEFLLRVMRDGFRPDQVNRGRFRDYLKASVRNAAVSHLRRRRPVQGNPEAMQQLSAVGDPETDAERAWLAQWRSCLLERAWQALEQHQRASPGNLFYTTLRVVVEHPDEDSPAQAARVSAQCGRPLRAEAFRKQLSRARERFARLIVEEVEQTLDEPSPADVDEELAAIGLLEQVRHYWTER